MPPLLEVFLRFLRLGVTAFGGPIAHLGYFRREFVERAGWLEDAAFTEIVALCTALPGPTSSQVGMVLGARRAGPLGAIAAWIGFTTPSAILMAVAGRYVGALFGVSESLKGACGRCGLPPGLRALISYLSQHPVAAAALYGGLGSLEPLAFAVVLLAVVNLYRTIATTAFARAVVPLAFLLSIAAFVWAPGFVWLALVAGALLGYRFAPDVRVATGPHAWRVPRRFAIAALATLIVMLVVLPLVATSGYGALFAVAFRAGSLVFGGGHVVLAFLTPLATAHVVSPGAFAYGYGIVQAVPGPLFTFATFLGAADRFVPNGWIGAFVATAGIFVPSFLMLPAALSLWSAVRRFPRAGGVLAGINASVVGLLAATFLDVFVPAFRPDLPPALSAIAFLAIGLLAVGRRPAWEVVCTVVLGSAAYAATAAALAWPAASRLV